MELEAGVSYRVDLTGGSSGAGTLSDPDLWGLYNTRGGYVGGFNKINDGGEGRDAVKVMTPEESGTYFVVARRNRTKLEPTRCRWRSMKMIGTTIRKWGLARVGDRSECAPRHYPPVAAGRCEQLRGGEKVSEFR